MQRRIGIFGGCTRPNCPTCDWEEAILDVAWRAGIVAVVTFAVVRIGLAIWPL